MVSIKHTDQQRLVEKSAEELKKIIKSPEWADYVKTGVSRERPPVQKDWWHLRAASILRKAYNGPVGTSRLRSYYGGLHRRGHKPAHFSKGSGKVIRTILKDLEAAGLLKKVDKPRKGRIITPAGQKLLNSAAKQIR